MSLARRLLIPGLVLGAVVRLAALPQLGTSDVDVWKIWSFGAAHDLTGVYGVGGSPPERRLLRWQGDQTTVNYPPIAMAELAAAGRLYEWWDPLFRDSAALNTVVKLPGLAAEALLVGLVLTWGRRRFGPEPAAWTALVLALNPAMVLTGSVLGYIDAQMAVPAVVALATADVGAGWMAGTFAAIATLTKPQVIFVFPVIGVVLISRRPVWRPAMEAILGAALTSSVVLLPYLVRGAWTNMVQALGRLATHDMLSGNAANLWWIVTWILRVVDVAGEWGWWRALSQEVRILAISRAIALGYPNPRVVGMVLVAAACGWAAWRSRGVSLATSAALAGWSAYAYALFAAQVHENHLYLAVPFFAVAAGLDHHYRGVLWWVSAIFTLNLLLFYGFGRGLPFPLERRWTGIDASVLLAFGSVCVFGWTTRRIAAQVARGKSCSLPLTP